MGRSISYWFGGLMAKWSLVILIGIFIASFIFLAKKGVMSPAPHLIRARVQSSSADQQMSVTSSEVISFGIQPK